MRRCFLLGLPLLVLSHVQASPNRAIDQGRAQTQQAREAPLPLETPRMDTQGMAPAQTTAIAGGASVKFTLKSVEIQGNSAITTDELKKIWSSKFNQDVSLAEVEALATSVGNYYRDRGYFLTQVIIPQQKINPQVGHVRLQVIEGILNRITVEGGTETERKLVESQLKDFPTGHVLNMKNIETRLLSVRKTPGYDIRPVLIKSKAQVGATDIIIKIERKKIAEFSVGGDNTGNKFVSKYKVSADAVLYNAVGRSKTLLATIHDYRGRHFNLYRARQTQLIGNYGTRAYVETMQSKSRPNVPFETKSKYEYINVMLMHPLIYLRNTNLKIRLAIDGQNDITRVFGSAYKQDYVRVGRLGLLYNRTFENDFFEVSGIAHKGFKRALGARMTSLPSRQGGTNDFLYGDGKVLWAHTFSDQWSLLTSGGWQVSRNPLLASEEMAVGSSSYARGYELSEVSGDHGAGGMVELRYMAKPFPKIFNYLQLYTSFGGAKVWNMKKKVDAERSDQVSSWAFGVRTNVFKNVYASFEAAKPMSKRSVIRDDKKWRFTAKINFKMAFTKDFTNPNLPR